MLCWQLSNLYYFFILLTCLSNYINAKVRENESKILG